MTARSFIPRDAPKSLVIGVIAVLSGLAAGAITFLGHYLGSSILFEGGRIFVYLCAPVALPMIAIGVIKALSGRYAQIQERSWHDQIL
jgi:hypothetical protein